MSRKHTRRRVIVPMPPRGLRKKLAPDQVRDLGFCHLSNVEAIAQGRATAEVLWHWAEGVLIWLRAAQLMSEGEPEMLEQHDVVTAVVARYSRTGKIVFTGPELQLAKKGTMVMDLIAERVDMPTALQASEWGKARMHELARDAGRAAA